MLSIGGEARLREAFASLELLVCVDIYRNATSEYAHYVLPAAGAFEREDVNITGMGMQDYAQRRRVFHAACRLLSSTEEPRRISKELGFTTTAEFSKQFEAVFDISPAIYRQKFGLPVEAKAKGSTDEEGA